MSLFYNDKGNKYITKGEDKDAKVRAPVILNEILL